MARPLFVTTAPRLVDMGAGGGLPGLVVAQQWPEASLVLLEANERRSAFLRRVVDRLELADRVSILQERAEICGRDREWRATFDGAIARSFGRPAVLAECAAPLLKPEAWVVVSEPPTSPRVPTAQPASALRRRNTGPPWSCRARTNRVTASRRRPGRARACCARTPCNRACWSRTRCDRACCAGTPCNRACCDRGGRAMAGGSASPVRPRTWAVAPRRVRLPAVASGRALSGAIPSAQWRASQEAVVLIRRAGPVLVRQSDTRGDPASGPRWSRARRPRRGARSPLNTFPSVTSACLSPAVATRWGVG